MGFDAPQSVWSQCQSQLQSELPEQQYNTWIRPLTLNQYETGYGTAVQGDVVRIVAPNRFVEDWVKNKFLTRIEELFYQLSGSEVVLDITARPAQSPQYQSQTAGENFEFSAASKQGQSTNLQIDPPPSVAIPQSAAESSLKSNLNEDFTFDSFVEGKSNQLAFAAAQQVAENPGGSYNPLFYLWGCGSG